MSTPKLIGLNSERFAFSFSDKIQVHHYSGLGPSAEIVGTNAVMDEDCDLVVIQDSDNVKSYSYSTTWSESHTAASITDSNLGNFMHISDSDSLTLSITNSENIDFSLCIYDVSLAHQIASITLDNYNLSYPELSANFEVLFTTNTKGLDEISGNIFIDPPNAGQIDVTNLQMSYENFKMVGIVEGLKSATATLKYVESGTDVSGQSIDILITVVDVSSVEMSTTIDYMNPIGTLNIELTEDVIDFALSDVSVDPTLNISNLTGSAKTYSLETLSLIHI